MTTELEQRARAWMDVVHPHARHLERAHAWLIELDPGATEGMRIAAALHDVERAFPDPGMRWDSAQDWASPEYNRWHQDRCADMAAAWLREQGASDGLVAEVDALVRAHEDGGWPQADLVQAADSLSFLETMTDLVIGWIADDRVPYESAEGKLRHSVERMNPGLVRARELGEPMLDAALERLAAARAGAAR